MREALDSALIGSVISSERFPLIVPDARDFVSPHAGRVWDIIQKMHATGAPINFGSVYTELLNESKNDEAVWLNEIMNGTHDPSNTEWFAKQVIDRGAARKLRRSLIDVASDESLSFRAAVEKVETAISTVTMDEWKGWKPLSKFIEEQVKVVERGGASGLKTGFDRLDRSVVGLRPGHVYIIAGRPSMGKTTLALQICLNVSGAGVPVLYFLLETSGEMIAFKTLSIEAGIPTDRVTSGLIGKDEWKEIAGVVDKKIGDRIFLDTSTDLSTSNLRSRVMSAREQMGIGLVVVDYLQLMTAPGNTERERINYISRVIGRVAKDAGVPVIALSQMSRMAEYERPSTHHLKESGNLEADADMVMLIWRHRAKMDADLDKRALLIDQLQGGAQEINWVDVAKNRYAGKLDVIPFRFNRRSGEFVEMPNA